MLKTADDAQAPMRVVEAVVAANDSRKRAMGRKVLTVLGAEPRGKTVAILGLTFKPNTDDMRDAPSIAIIQALQDAGLQVRAHDPEGIEQARPLFEDVEFCDNPYLAAIGADALVIVTEWDEYRALDFKRLTSVMARPVVVDLRNIYVPAEIKAAGLEYHSIGRR